MTFGLVIRFCNVKVSIPGNEAETITIIICYSHVSPSEYRKNSNKNNAQAHLFVCLIIIIVIEWAFLFTINLFGKIQLLKMDNNLPRRN